MKNKKLLIVAAEVSADHHAAELVRGLLEKQPDMELYGIGGDALKALGMKPFYDVSQMAFLGIGEVIKHLPFIRKVHNHLVEWAKKEKPAGVLLVDYPGFNLRLAKSIHALNIPISYYISPQLWAWGQKRVKKIRAYITRMIVLFPFEKKFYKKHGIEADYVGHPLVDHHHAYLPEVVKKVTPENIVLGILPGSRKQEVASLLDRMLESARILKKQGKINRVEVVRVGHLPLQLYTSRITEQDDFITLIEEPFTSCLNRYDAVLVASGTATLECGYYGVPMVIVYEVNPLTYYIGKLLVKIDFIGLVNIVAEKEVAKELIQKEFTIENSVHQLTHVLQPEQNAQIRTQLKVIKEKLGAPGASKRAADVVFKMLNGQA